MCYCNTLVEEVIFHGLIQLVEEVCLDVVELNHWCDCIYEVKTSFLREDYLFHEGITTAHFVLAQGTSTPMIVLG